MRKIPFAGIELTSQRVRRLRGAYHGPNVIVLLSNIVIIGVLTVDLLSPSQLMSVQHVCKGLEFRVGYEAFYGNDHGKRKHIHH